jgi:Tol biopolymer transport system component
VRRALPLASLALFAGLLPAAQWAALPGANGRIAFTRDNIGYTTAPDGSDERRLNGLQMAGPEFSPDGTRLAFNSLSGSGGLFVANADGSRQHRISRNYAIDPAWSPDGSRIAYISSARVGHVIVVNADGTGFRRRLTNDIYGDYSVSWSPDGRRLDF